MRANRVLAATLAAIATVVAAPLQARALPDLVPEITEVEVNVRDVLQGDVDEGCAVDRFNRRLVEFDLRTKNIGVDDLILGNPGCPNCTFEPGAACANPLFVCGESHGHAHFESFAQNRVLDSEGNVVAEGRKYGFCLLDTGCATPHYSCSYQGLTAGCSDIYASGLPCQYVDITDAGLADGVYTLRITIDPDGILAESDDSNNTIEVPFTVGSTPRVCPEYTSTDIPQTIPALGSVASTLTVPDIGPVRSLRLKMNGTHTYVSDLDVTLTSPMTTTASVFSDICGMADNFDIYVGDDAIDDLICPITDPEVLRTPAASFDVFHDEDAAGDWTLTIDDTSVNDSGSLAAWSLEVCSICGNGVVDFGETCDDGNVSDGDCCSSDCMTQAADGTTCEDDNACTMTGTCDDGACISGGDLECDPCLVCDTDEGCAVPDIVYPCQEPATNDSILRVRRNPLNPSRDSVLWKWRSQTPVELDEFGAPEAMTDLSLCIYEGGNLMLSSTIPAASTCGGVPCWTIDEHDAQFRDKASQYEGLSALRVREGANGKILLKGRGSDLELGELFPSLPVTVRLRRNDGTPCWEANFDSTVRSSDTLFKARSR